MKLHWLLPSLASILFLSLPAEAARLQDWRFDADRNRLFFTTNGGVQPKAQLIANPTRLVIDLPGTTLGRPTVNQPVGGAIRSIRVGQFDNATARLVVELSPGYTLDPQQVKFRGLSPTRWTVELPDPEPISTAASAPSLGGLSSRRRADELSDTNVPVVAASDDKTQVRNLRVTPDGFFIQISGDSPKIELERSDDRQSVDIELQGATLAEDLSSEMSVNEHGVSRIRFTQVQASPPVARVRLSLSDPDADWSATSSNLGGVIVLPQSKLGNSSGGSSPIASALEENIGGLATIEAVELASSGTQVLIRGDRQLNYRSGWDRNSGAYQITIPSARLAEGMTTPERDLNSSVLSVRVEQAGPETVMLLVRPAAGVQVEGVNQPGNRMLAVQLKPYQAVVPVPPPDRATPTSPPPRRNRTPNYTRDRNTRVAIAIDPGHGGRDPGAVGIGGLQEKHVVLPISQRVAELLEQEGIQAVLTRRDDREIDLAPRVQLANRLNANLFVSIHANAISMSRPDVNGVETYYYSSGRALAQTIQNSILQATGAPNRGVRRARFYVLRHTAMPAVLVEVGFVTGRDDAPRLADASYRELMAQAIARGILQYVRQNY